MLRGFSNIGKNVKPAIVGVAGGAAGRVVKNKVLTMIPMVKDYPKFHGGVTFLLGAALMGSGKMRDFGFGMSVVAGTDLLGQFVPMVSSGGIGDDVLEVLADDLSNTLEQSIEDDVSNEQAAMNSVEDNEYMNGGEDDEDSVNGSDSDYYTVNDDVSNEESAMNAV